MIICADPWSLMKKEVIIIIIALVLIGGFLFLNRVKIKNQTQGPAPTATVEEQVSPSVQSAATAQPSPTLTSGLPPLGSEAAPVKIVEYGDYQCPFCRKLFMETELRLREDFVNKGLAVFYWKDFAFLGQESIWTAVAARCANEQGRFWDYHDLLFQRQGPENAGVFSKDNLKKLAASLNLDATAFNSCLDQEKYKDLVLKDTAEGQQAGVRGTPFLLIGDKKAEGAYPYEAIKAMVEEELKTQN